MKLFYKNGFMGVISSDEIPKLILKAKDRMSFIMNSESSNKKGEHWMAVYIDTIHDKSIKYYDSFGEDSPKNFLHDIKKLIDHLQSETYLTVLNKSSRYILFF